MAEPTDNNILTYLPYVTLRDIFKETRGLFTVWVILSGLSVLLVGAFKYAESYFRFELEKIENIDHFFLPQWLWLSIVVAALSWFMKGKEIRFVFPVLGIKSWLFFTFLTTSLFFTLYNLEWWVSLPFVWALVATEVALVALEAKGKENYKRMNDEG